MFLTRLACCLAVILLLVPATAGAQVEDDPVRGDVFEDEAEGERAPREKRFDVRLSLGIEYDDNILNLRDDRIAEFESGVFPPDRFLINSVDDVILVPSVDLAYGVTPASRKRSRIRLTANAFRFLDNSIKDYESYRLRFEQDLSDLRKDLDELEVQRQDLTARRFRAARAFRKANRTRFSLDYSYGSQRYGNQLRDDDGGGRKSTFYVYDSWRATHIQRLNRGETNRFDLLLQLRHDELDYNSDFDERDSKTDRYALGLDWYHLLEERYWLMGLTYQQIDRNSNTSLIGRPGPAGVIEDDVSYDAETLTFTSGLFWYREKGGRALYKKSGLQFWVSWTVKDYTTKNVGDLTHYLRDDDRLEAAVTFTHALSNDFSLRMGAEHTEQDTNLDPVPGFDRLEPSSYDSLILFVRLRYYTGWKSRA